MLVPLKNRTLVPRGPSFFSVQFARPPLQEHSTGSQQQQLERLLADREAAIAKLQVRAGWRAGLCRVERALEAKLQLWRSSFKRLAGLLS